MTKIVLLLISFYQRFISPLTPRSCRYYPTCSAYMYQAIVKFGLLKGFYLGSLRLLRCNPFSDGGYDPVPDK